MNNYKLQLLRILSNTKEVNKSWDSDFWPYLEGQTRKNYTFLFYLYFLPLLEFILTTYIFLSNSSNLWILGCWWIKFIFRGQTWFWWKCSHSELLGHLSRSAHTAGYLKLHFPALNFGSQKFILPKQHHSTAKSTSASYQKHNLCSGLNVEKSHKWILISDV